MYAKGWKFLITFADANDKTEGEIQTIQEMAAPAS